MYYLAYALSSAEFTDQGRLYGVVALVVVGSVLLHGLTAGPVMTRLDSRRGVLPASETTEDT